MRCGHVRDEGLLLDELARHACEDATDKLDGRLDQDQMLADLRDFYSAHEDQIWADVCVPAIYAWMRLAQEAGAYPKDRNWPVLDLVISDEMNLQAQCIAAQFDDPDNQCQGVDMAIVADLSLLVRQAYRKERGLHV